MKRRIFIRGGILIFAFALLFTGCSKEEDELAQECVEMIEQAIDMSEFQANLIVPDNAVRSSKKASGDTWSWTFNYMGGTWTFYWTYEEDATKHYWTMEIQFGDGERYDYITAWEMKDGSGGEVVYSFNWVLIYEEEYSDYEDLHWTYSWDLDTSGTYHISWTCDADIPDFDFFM